MIHNNIQLYFRTTGRIPHNVHSFLAQYILKYYKQNPHNVHSYLFSIQKTRNTYLHAIQLSAHEKAGRLEINTEAAYQQSVFTYLAVQFRDHLRLDFFSVITVQLVEISIGESFKTAMLSCGKGEGCKPVLLITSIRHQADDWRICGQHLRRAERGEGMWAGWSWGGGGSVN